MRHTQDIFWTTKRIIWTIVAVVVGITLLSWGAYALSVAMSAPKGIGDSIIKKNSVENRIAAQARFEKLYQGVVSADQKIAVHRSALEADPKSSVLQTNLTGVTTICLGLIADYNAESRKFLSEDFKAIDLPYQIDQTDPTTDCK